MKEVLDYIIWSSIKDSRIQNFPDSTAFIKFYN